MAEDLDVALLSIEEVCDALRVDESGLLRLVALGRFPRAIELEPGSVRWPRQVLVAWVAGLEEEAQARQQVTDINSGTN